MGHFYQIEEENSQDNKINNLDMDSFHRSNPKLSLHQSSDLRERFPLSLQNSNQNSQAVRDEAIREEVIEQREPVSQEDSSMNSDEEDQLQQKLRNRAQRKTRIKRRGLQFQDRQFDLIQQMKKQHKHTKTFPVYRLFSLELYFSSISLFFYFSQF